MIITIPIVLRGNDEVLTVDYDKNTSPIQSGFDALDLPFPIERCIGYPTIHAYFKNMNLTGYKRYCGFIQFVQMVEQKSSVKNTSTMFIDVDEYSNMIGNPYFSYGYPASLYDAPCNNLGNCDFLEWTAFTYLVDMPTRMNQNKLKFITGFSWGYDEDKNGPVKLHEIKMLNETKFEEHYQFMLHKYPNFAK